MEGIIPLKCSNIFILIWKWIFFSFFFFILRFLQDTVLEEWMILVIEANRNRHYGVEGRRFSAKILMQQSSFCSISEGRE